MGSVNPNVRVQLPTATAARAEDDRPADQVGTPASGFLGGLSSMGSSIGNVLTDAATFAGAETDEDGNIKAGVDLPGLGGFAALTTGPTAFMALRNRVSSVTGEPTPYLDRLGAQAAGNAIRVTPTLVSAILGPAIADGVTMIAPNLVKKHKDTKDIKSAEEKKAAEKNNQYAKYSRGIAGAVVVGVAAGAVFLLKPDLFKKFGDGVALAIEGSTRFTVDGKAHRLAGVLDADQIRTVMAATKRPIVEGAAIGNLKTVLPMAKDAVFSNRALVAATGGIGTLLLANKAAGEEDAGQQKLWWGITGAAALATVGGTYGIGKLTQGSIAANGGAGGILSKNTLLMKPNIEWIKKYAVTIAPITAAPAGTAAMTYFNIFNDFDEITAPRSPFRK